MVDLAILDGVVYCSDLGLARAAVDAPDTGMAWINQPGGSEAGSDTDGAVAAVRARKARHRGTPRPLALAARHDRATRQPKQRVRSLLLSHLEQWARAHG
jgi:hypothetical protein